MNLDAVNAGFEIVGSALVFQNVLTLLRAREAKGVYLPTQAFFVLWGCFNLAYYSSIGHWASFWAQVGMVVGQGLWFGLAVYFRRKRGT